MDDVVTRPAAVLCSGGLDSTVLLADELSRGGQVQPIHIRCGLAWEDAEARVIGRLLASPPFANRAPAVVTLSVTARDLYPDQHWAIQGTPPAFDTPDEDVYLEGRNLLLISKAAVWCRQHDVHRLALASLSGNPFPDATPAFFAAMAQAVSLGLDHPIEVVAPYLSRTKREVARRGLELGVPLELTLSCMKPGAGDVPCGACSKCREREDALRTLDSGTRDSGTPGLRNPDN